MKDYKLEYMTHLLSKIAKKKMEAYVIGRIWHQLDNDKVKFVVQQYIQRTEDKYALADLYLPQVGMFIEINEDFHKNNKEIDSVRNEEIRKTTGITPVVIDCGNEKTMEDIHAEISKVVKQIKQAIKDKGKNFIPWCDNEYSPDYYQEKGYLRVGDNEYVRTIDDACAIFNTQAKHRGYLRVAGADIPNKENERIWCPCNSNNTWGNDLSENGMEIREYHRTSEQKNWEHVEKFLPMNQRRVAFFKEKDELGLSYYRFVGVFELDKEKTMAEKRTVWHRVDDYYKL